MKKNDLKQLIKPLVKECIHEMLIEEGLLSNVVSEVAKGMQDSLIVESVTPATTEVRKQPKSNNKAIMERRKKMMEAIGSDAYNGVDLFVGTEPMTNREANPASGGPVDLGRPSDAGVDISSLIGGASKIWEGMK
jgi:hypothetical protein